ncbi:MAG: lipopolysaccharide kinase InaA family protein [Planctomycetota bacterium]
MQGGQILKNGDTCFVSRINLAGQDIVVKRYNHKGIIHSARHTIKKSRARRCWLHAHRLTMLNIATPRPLAYVEQRRKKLVWKSYLITKYVDGQKLRDFLQDNKPGQEKHSKVTRQLMELLAKLEKHRVTHGDLKHTNILLTSEGLVLTDLDSMRVHRYGWTYRWKRGKDIARLPAMNTA